MAAHQRVQLVRRVHAGRWSMSAAEKIEDAVCADDARQLFAELDQIHLVALDPEKRRHPEGRDFGRDIDAAVAWAAQSNAGGLNIYWTVNLVRPGVNKKPSKDDIEAARFAHVDVDPPKDGSPFDPAAVAAAFEESQRPPSFVIDSGNGLQAFWRLDDGCANLPSIEAINVQLRDHFGGDSCQNIDRLMRVPGFVNYPDHKKRAAGRVARVAGWVAPDEGLIYAPEEIRAAFPQSAPKPGPSNALPGAPDAGCALITPDDLGLPQMDGLRSAIEHPPGRDRSGDGLAVARLMANAKFADEQILGILLNPVNAVSAHFLAQRDPRRQVLRVIGVVRRDDGQGSPASEVNAPASADAPLLDLDDAADWHDIDVPPRKWLLQGWFPLGEMGLWTGAGAVGKSLATQQLAVCISAGKPFLGIKVMQGPSIYITCEDSKEEVQRRFKAISAQMGVRLAHGQCRMRSWKGELDLELAVFDKERKMKPTDRFASLRKTALATGAKLLVLDNTSHLFGGDENVKREVAAFTNLMNGLAAEMGGVVLLLGHPNKTGLNNPGAADGNQFGGSVGWENQVRSRVFQSAPNPDDPDLREITNPKANYAAKGGSARFRWYMGAFVRDEDLPSAYAAELGKAVRANAENETFLACLRTREAQGEGRLVGPAPGPNYAPTQFEGMPEAKGMKRERLKLAMERLFATDAIEAFTYRNKAKGRDVTVIREVCRSSPNATPELVPNTFPELPRTTTPNYPAHTPISKDIEGAASGPPSPSDDGAGQG